MADARGVKSQNIKSVNVIPDNICNDINDAIFIHDLTGHFLLVNKEACRRLGYSQKELLKLSPQKIDLPKFANLVGQKIQELQKVGKIVFESEHLTKTGKAIPVEISSSVIDYHGRPAILSVARDITRRRMSEQVLSERQAELEKINRLMVGRELKMITLKEKIKILENRLAIRQLKAGHK